MWNTQDQIPDTDADAGIARSDDRRALVLALTWRALGKSATLIQLQNYKVYLKIGKEKIVKMVTL